MAAAVGERRLQPDSEEIMRHRYPSRVLWKTFSSTAGTYSRGNLAYLDLVLELAIPEPGGSGSQVDDDLGEHVRSHPSGA